MDMEKIKEELIEAISSNLSDNLVSLFEKQQAEIDELKQQVFECDPPCQYTSTACNISVDCGKYTAKECWNRYFEFLKDNDQTKPDVADKDVGNIAEPTHEGCKYYSHAYSSKCGYGRLNAIDDAKDCKHFEPKRPTGNCSTCIGCEVNGMTGEFIENCSSWIERDAPDPCEKDSCDQCNECGSIDEPDSEKSDEPILCTECNRRKKVLKKRSEKIRNQRKELALLNRRFSELKAVKIDEILPLWLAALSEKITCRCDTLKAKCRAYENAITSQAVCANKGNIFQCVVCKHTHNCLSYCRYEFDFERFSDKGGGDSG